MLAHLEISPLNGKPCARVNPAERVGLIGLRKVIFDESGEFGQIRKFLDRDSSKGEFLGNSESRREISSDWCLGPTVGEWGERRLQKSVTQDLFPGCTLRQRYGWELIASGTGCNDDQVLVRGGRRDSLAGPGWVGIHLNIDAIGLVGFG